MRPSVITSMVDAADTIGVRLDARRARQTRGEQWESIVVDNGFSDDPIGHPVAERTALTHSQGDGEACYWPHRACRHYRGVYGGQPASLADVTATGSGQLMAKVGSS